MLFSGGLFSGVLFSGGLFSGGCSLNFMEALFMEAFFFHFCAAALVANGLDANWSTWSAERSFSNALKGATTRALKRISLRGFTTEGLPPRVHHRGFTTEGSPPR
eukprot:622864-Prorocentrum_minimum.AAC.1